MPRRVSLYSGAEPHNASLRVWCHPPIDVFWCFVKSERKTAMQLTVAEMSQSLLQWDQMGDTYLVRSCMQSWIGMPYHGLTAVKNRRVILPV